MTSSCSDTYQTHQLSNTTLLHDSFIICWLCPYYALGMVLNVPPQYMQLYHLKCRPFDPICFGGGGRAGDCFVAELFKNIAAPNHCSSTLKIKSQWWLPQLTNFVFVHFRYDQDTETQLVLAWYKHYDTLRLLAGVAWRGPYTVYSDLYEILNDDGEFCESEPTVCTYRLNTGSNQQPMSWCNSRICMSVTGVASNVGNWAGTVHIILTIVPQQYDDVAAGIKDAMKDHYPD